METYLVGGAVRDALLGLPVHERDWVVVGATPEEMKARGFLPVGKDFPVFLHPKTREEYALARTERKSGPGYHGFTFYAAPDVTLEQDLRRRDLTINAMARAPDGTLIDPYEGQRDLKARVLRHVSPAFSEDPLRVLRVARFASRFSPLGFRIAKETQRLMVALVEAGEIHALVPERVWREMERALGEAAPHVFFEVLLECGALAVLMPALANALEYDRRALDALRLAAERGHKPSIRYAALLEFALDDETHVRTESKRVKAPNTFVDLATLAARHRDSIHQVMASNPERLLSLLEAVDAFRRPQRLDDLLAVLRTDATIRAKADDYPQEKRLLAALTAARQIKGQTLAEQGFSGPGLGEALHRARRDAIGALESSENDQQQQAE